MTTLDDIYSDRILALAADIPHSSRLAHPDATATAHSKLCGSTVTVDIAMDGETISDFGQSVKACLLGQSSAAIVGHHIVGTTAEEFHRVASEVRRMLKEGASPPTGRWADLEVLEPVRDYKARHASTLLVFDAVERAIAEVKEKRRSGAATSH